MLIMTSIIRVGQSKFVTIPIDEDSQERIMNCLQTLSELKVKEKAEEVFLHDTKAAYSKMLSAQEVWCLMWKLVCCGSCVDLGIFLEKGSGEEGEGDEGECYSVWRPFDVQAILEERGWWCYWCEFSRGQLFFVCKLTYVFDSTTPMLDVQLELVRFRTISSRVSVAYHNSLVSSNVLVSIFYTNCLSRIFWCCICGGVC